MKINANVEDLKNVVWAKWLLVQLNVKGISDQRLWDIAEDFRKKGIKKID